MTHPPLLFLSQCLPYPPTSGVTNRTFHILRQLREEFAVHLVAFFRRNHQPTRETIEDAVGGLKGVGIQVAGVFPISSERSPFRRLLAHGCSVARGRPYTHYEYADPRCADTIQSLRAGVVPRLAHMDSLDLYRWLPEFAGLPVTCTHHSIESELLRLRARRMKSPLPGWYLRYQAGLIERVERALCPRFALNIMMSDLDGSRLASLAPGSATCTIPNGVDVTLLRPREDIHEIQGRVLFLGPTYMFPNRDGVGYFLEQVWPHVLDKVPEASFVLVGKVSRADRQRLERYPRTRCEGFVEDVRPHLAAAACCIAPLRVGGGTRLKILDYWAMGKPTVATTVGAEGLKAEDGVNILIRDDPYAFAEGVIAVLRDPGLRRRLSQVGRKTAVESYSWEAIGRSLRERYHNLITELR